MKNKVEIQNITITKYRDHLSESVQDFCAVEAPLLIKINEVPFSVTMRTPGDDIALSLGFLYTEGVFLNYENIANTIQVDEDTVNIVTEVGVDPQVNSISKNFYTTSSCGVCGKSSIEAITTISPYKLNNNDFVIDHRNLNGMQDKLLNVQQVFEKTGGIHASALFSKEGNYIFHSEDVGRHNALDKLIGHAWMAEKLPLSDRILLLSGRASFELIQKASMAGIGFIVSVGAPSSLAISLAEKNGQTLIGFLKKNSFNVYTGHGRIK